MRSRLSLHSACLILAVAILTPFARGMGADHPADKPVGGSSAWPAGLKDLVNSKTRVHGYFINASDTFFFAGDAKALNAFLADYAKLKGTSIQVILKEGPKKARSPWDKADRDIDVDWMLYGADIEWGAQPGARVKPAPDEKYATRVEIFLGRGVKLADLVVPVELQVTFSDDLKGAARQDIEKFVTDHARKREEAKDKAEKPGKADKPAEKKAGN